MRFTHVITAIGLLASTGCSSDPPQRDDPKEPSEGPSVMAHDELTTPGAKARLRVKVEGSLGRDLERERVVFELLGKSASDLTDHDGVAEASFTPGKAGTFAFAATLPGRPEVARTLGTVWVVEPRNPVVICDIDGTISSMSQLKVPFSGDEADTYPQAPEVLADLARTHLILYLTARDDGLNDKTRAFLTLHGFPTGPVIYNDWGLGTPEEREQLNPANHGKFKLGVIRKLLDRKVNIVAGIGDSETDAWAYEQAGIKSYLRSEEQADGPTFRFDHYSKLRERLIGDGLLPAEQD